MDDHLPPSPHARCTTATIKRYEPIADAKKRLAQLTKNAEAVHRKIEKMYGITDEPSALHPEWDVVAKRAADLWSPERSDITPADAHQLAQWKEAIDASMHDYLKVFAIHQALVTVPKTQAKDERYQLPEPREDLYEIYANHITNAVEARLISFGMDTFAAHQVNGYILGHAIDAARAFMDPDAHIDPVQHPTRTGAGEQVQHLRGYWQERRDDLTKMLKATQL